MSLRQKNKYSAIVFLLHACISPTPLTRQAELVRIAPKSQHVTFRLNDECRQAPVTVTYKDVNQLRNIAAEYNMNVIQLLYENPYAPGGEGRLWTCPETMRWD